MKKLSAIALIVAGALTPTVFHGCGLFNSSSNAGTQPALIASATSPIADVPVPAGFYMSSESTSKVVPATGLRFVDHRYKGKDGYLSVVRFFREELPQRGWKIIDQNQIKEEITLRFSKNNEEALITVWEGTLHTHIRIRIDPAGRNAR